MGRSSNKKSRVNNVILIAAAIAFVIASVAWYYGFVVPSEGHVYGSCFGPLSKCNAVVYNNTLYVKFFNVNPKIKNATFYFLPSTSQANGGIADSFNNAIISINTPQGKPLNLSNTKTFTVAFNLSGPPDYFPNNYSYNVNGYVDIIGGYYNNNTKFNETAAIIAKPNVSETGT